MKRSVQTSFAVFLIAILLTFCGCGKPDEKWPSNVENDWIKNVNGKGMANVWGVIFDIAGVEDTETSINPEATLGNSCSETTGKNILVFGKRVIELEATGTESLKLSINGMDYGKVRINNRVVIDVDGNVYVDQKLRKAVEIEAVGMKCQQAYVFYCSENAVWLASYDLRENWLIAVVVRREHGCSGLTNINHLPSSCCSIPGKAD